MQKQLGSGSVGGVFNATNNVGVQVSGSVVNHSRSGLVSLLLLFLLCMTQHLCQGLHECGRKNKASL